jgi:MFS family permease
MAFFVALLVEVPSGAIADAIGCKKVVIFGQILSGVGILVQAIGHTYEYILIWQILMMTWVSLTSWSVEALFYSNLGVTHESDIWRKVLTRWLQWALIAGLVATVIGGWLHTMDPALPWILTGISFILSAWLLITLWESRVWDKTWDMLGIIRNVASNMRDGFHEFLKPSFAYYIPVLIVLQWLFYAAWYGVLRMFMLDRFWFSPFLWSVVLTLIIVVTIGFLELLHKYDAIMTESRIIHSIGFLCIWGLLFSVFPIGYYGAIVIFILYAGQRLMYVKIADSIARKSSEVNRATMLSIYSFLRAFPYIFLAPILGYLNMQDNLWIFFVVWSIIILVSLVLSRRLR